jgi:hypothetical protein
MGRALSNNCGLSLTEMSTLTHVSPRTLTRALRDARLHFPLFRAMIAASRYWEIRMSNPELPDKVIADQLGFKSADRFYALRSRWPGLFSLGKNPALPPQPFLASALFSRESGRDVYSRAEIMSKAMVGTSLRGLREAWCGEQAGMLILVRYDSLCARPSEVMRQLYVHLGEPFHEHDFENLDFRSPTFDEILGLHGIHTITGPVSKRTRETVLPADLFEANADCFWETDNPRGEIVL